MLSSIQRGRSPRVVAAATGVVALLMVVMATISASSVNAANSPFKILFVTSLSGPLGFVGKTEANGYQAGVDVVNSQGGILGSKVELKVVDDAGTGAKAVAAALQETSSTDYHLITCGSFGDDGLACAPAIKSKPALQIPAIAEGSINNPKKYPRTFNSGGLFDNAELGMAQRMKKNKVKKVAIVVGDNATGRTASGILSKAIKKTRLKVAKVVFVPLGATDATPQLQQAQASGADAIATTGFTPSNIAIMKARAKLGWTAALYCDWYCSSANLGVLTDAERKGVVSQVWPFMVKGSKGQQSKEFKAMDSSFFKLQGSTMPLAITAAQVTYNIPILARAAAKKAKSTAGPKMAKALERIRLGKDAKGFVGPKLLFTPKNHAFGTQPSDFIYIKAGVMTGGYITPGS